MTINDLIRAAGEYPWHVLAFFAIPPVLTGGLGLLHEKRRPGGGAPFKYLYSALIYVVTFPGVMAAVLTGYGVFFLRADLRSVPILMYFVPIVSMLCTWLLMRRQVDLDAVPGFERLSALVFSVALCFAAAFAVNRLFFGVLFFGSLWGLLGVALGFFILLRATWRRAVG